MSKLNRPTSNKFNLRGFTLQFFLITVLPLTALLLVVAFGSQTLHHDAMRNLVGDRDLRTVRAASNSLEREIAHISSTIQILSRSLIADPNLSSSVLKPEDISSIFDGGIALFSTDGHLLQSSSTLLDWQSVPGQIPESFKNISENTDKPSFSTLISNSDNSHFYIIVSVQNDKKEVIAGAFSPARIIENAIGNQTNSDQATVLVVGPTKTKGNYDVLYRAGPIKSDESDPSHPGIKEALSGESGINYYQSKEGEHVVAFNPILPTGWGLIVEEAWEDITSPYLSTTQSAPLVIVPVFLLALLAIFFGARRIVSPLQKLEKQAARLAEGDFDAIQNPVGGIDEIRNLQTELIEMADKLKAAQQSLHSYIGAITAGVENERRSLARELHDDTIQSLIALNQRIQMILMNSPEPQKSPFNELQNLVQQSMSNLRRIIRGLRPIYLEDLGLVASLGMLVREIEQSANFPISFISHGTERRLTPLEEMALYRMVQESLNNVIHHAKANHAWVEIEYGETDVVVQIRDDGLGFLVPPNSSEFAEKGHFGLLGLQERAEIIHAELSITSEFGKGTNIVIRLSNSDNQ